MAITEEQKERRKKGIFASDAAQIMEGEGVRIALEKMGLAEPQNFDDNMEIEIGNLLEPKIMDAYELIKEPLGFERSPDTAMHPQHTWLGAHLDAIVDDVNVIKNCEIKTCGGYNRKFWGDGGDEVPDRVLFQTQVQMAVAGIQETDVAVAFVNENALKCLLTGRPLPITIFTIAADEELQAYIIEKSKRIWDCIENNTLPEAEKFSDAKLLYGKASGEIIEADQEMLDEYLALLSTKQTLARIEEEKEQRELKIKSWMKNASELRSGGKTIITWRNDKDSFTLDKKSLTEKHPKIVKKFLIPKSGARKFLLKPVKEN